MLLQSSAPWLVLGTYALITWWAIPRRTTSSQFFDGRSERGVEPGIVLVALSAAISWVFAKSVVNAADLTYAFGINGAVGYALYYLSFAVAGAAIYVIRRRGRYTSLSHFLTDKYGALCARLFLLAIAFRLFNEVWSNTKVMALYFGTEGSGAYWIAVVLITGFTAGYAWSGGLRASLLTDRVQALLVFLLLAVVLAVLFPGLTSKGLPDVEPMVQQSGWTFCALALVQVLSYPFHDPVLTDRGFLNAPRKMLAAFLLAGAISGGVILLFGAVGLYAKAFGLPANPAESVPAALGLAMMLIFNGIMLLSGGSTIDSTFASVSKLAARDWRNDRREPAARHLRTGRIAVICVAVLGNLPLLTIYLGDRAGPAVIAATTISGTMVMGLAPIFLLSWIRQAGALSFHLAFWPGVAIGVLRTVETFAKVAIFPDTLALGTGTYAIDLGLNVFGLMVCTAGYGLGALIAPRRRAPALQR